MKKIEEYISLYESDKKTHYLNPKSQWHGTAGFPTEPKTDDVISCLESKGFIKYIDTYDEYKDLERAIRELAKKCDGFMIPKTINDKDTSWIRFWKQGQITKETPIFFSRLNKKGKITLMDSTSFISSTYSDQNDSCMNDKTYRDYTEFSNDVNKYFGWK